jgi:hypothetical protein
VTSAQVAFTKTVRMKLNNLMCKCIRASKDDWMPNLRQDIPCQTIHAG